MLAGETFAHGNNGSIRIDRLSIGDYIYDSDGELRKIINIRQRTGESIMLYANNGIHIHCSKDCTFVNRGNKVEAYKIKHIDRLQGLDEINKQVMFVYTNRKMAYDMCYWLAKYWSLYTKVIWKDGEYLVKNIDGSDVYIGMIRDAGECDMFDIVLENANTFPINGYILTTKGEDENG